MLKSLTEIFKSDEFIPSSAVFPDIDKDGLTRSLKLEDEGRRRGGENLPEHGAATLDHIELKAISKIEDLRRRGLENYENNRRVYSERLNSAVSARMLVETEANDSKAKFNAEITRWKSDIVTARERVVDAFNWRKKFKERNKLERPAKEVHSMASLFALAFFLVLVESGGNAYLFAQKNPLGLLGGLMAAFLVSVVNVLICTFFGMFIRYVNCRGFQNILKTLVGLVFFIGWGAFTLGYNLGVAHFRDAVERVGGWREAGEAAILTLQSAPLTLQTMESYLLFALGALISIGALLKSYFHFDPYPGYAKINHDVVQARLDYVELLDESIEDLSHHSDEAVDGLRDANDEVHRNVNDSIDALFGQKALQSNLGPFLEQCDIAANYLLSVYRDANKAARSEKPPAYFKKSYAFEKIEPSAEVISRRTDAEDQVREVSELVARSVQEIFDVFNNAVDSHYEIDELEGTVIERRNGGTSSITSGVSTPSINAATPEKAVFDVK